MEVLRVHVGGWFQRTRLHLGEMYDFLREAESPLALDPKELKRLRKQLVIDELELRIDVLEYIYLHTVDGITVRIYEDGLIVLSTEHSGDIQSDVKRVTSYYEKKAFTCL